MRLTLCSAVLLTAAIQAPAGQAPPAANWFATAQTVLDVAPDGWTSSSPVVIFASAAGGEIEPYRCFAETWKAQGIRTVIPLMAGGITFEQRRSRWRQLNIVYEALRREARGNWRRPPSPAGKIVFAGHSFGAYVTLLAAGADSRVNGEQAGNCTDAGCSPLPAAGYVIISGQPAQNAKSEPLFWFARDAFRNLAPSRLVVFGTQDFVATDACMTAGAVATPSCRGDAHTVNPQHSTLIVVPDFTHGDFSCVPPEANRARLTAVQRQLGEWILKVTK
jgi:hypothetical protein